MDIASRRSAGVSVVSCCSVAATLIALLNPAAAFYSEVKPSVKAGLDCVGPVSVLAPKLTVCAIPGTKTRLWCPNGQMFEGANEQGAQGELQVSLARSLCSMLQVR